MENYNKLFLLEDPEFDMDKWSKEDYRSPEAMPKGNIQISTQLNAAYFGQPKLDKDALKSFHVPVKLSDGTWNPKGTFSDLLKAVYEGDNDVKDARADAAAEHRSEISDARIEGIIATMQLTYVPTIATKLELADLEAYVKSASSYKSYEAKQVGDGNRIEFGFGVAFSSDKSEMIVTRNGVIVDAENYAIQTVESGEGIAVKVINPDGSDAEAPVEGEVFAIFTEREVIEVQAIEEKIIELQQGLGEAQAAYEKLKASNETLLDSIKAAKSEAAAKLAKVKEELTSAESEVTSNLDALAIAESIDKVASLKTELGTGRELLNSLNGTLRNTTFAVANSTTDITDSNTVISDNNQRMAEFIDAATLKMQEAETERMAQAALAKAVDKASHVGEA